MSKANNVNPDYYKVSGRERPGNVVAKAREQRAEMGRQAASRWEKRQMKQQQNKRER